MSDPKWTSGDKIESLASEQAKADPSGQPPPGEAPPVPADVLSVPREGLEDRTGERKRVLIIGGGMAGLVAAYELRRQGHDPVVFEAQGRVGGRIYTLRAPFGPELYAEAGAMRIPSAHDLTMEYCRLFDLPMRPFVMGNPKGIVYVGGERMTAAEANEHPERLPFNLAADRARPIGRFSVAGRDRRHQGDGRQRRRPGVAGDRAPLRRVLAVRISEVPRLQ